MHFRPPIEEIKSKYYREMKRFISIPNNFKGVSESKRNPIFQTIVERNANGLMMCFLRSQFLFKTLNSVMDIFKVINYNFQILLNQIILFLNNIYIIKDYVALGQVDIENLVETNLKDVSDWERNFKTLKTKGREAEKLPK